MKFLLAAILVAGLGLCSFKSHSQVNFGTASNQFTYTPVNGGTGGIVGVVIPNGGGTVVNVATGSAALPLQNINNMADSTLVQLGDDGWRNVALPFIFPYWGQPFNNSTMYSNGAVQFGSPVVGYPTNNAFCCHGQDLTTLTNPAYNYAIMPLWTDLVDITGNTTYYRGTANSMTYGWYDTRQYGGRNNSSSFELKINSSGAFDVRYGNAFISQTQYVTSGLTGDLSKGQYFQYYHGLGVNIPTNNPVSYGTTASLGTVDPCLIDVLSSPSCPGYQVAYRTQQCTISALFDPSCPGYAIAFHDQQCYINPLFMPDCPGYYQAFHDQQCSINTLFATDCPGYAAAYLSQQCSMNTLYSTTCPGYDTAYRNYQFAQACNANPQASPTCPGYVTPVVSTTTINTNTSSPTATQTANQTAAAVTAVAIAASQNQQPQSAPLSTNAPPTTMSVNSSGTMSSPTQVAIVADAVVNNVILNNNTNAAPSAAAPAAPAAAANNPPPTSSPASPVAAGPAPSPTPASNNQLPPPAAASQNTNQPARANIASKPTKEQADSMGSNAMKDSNNAGSMEQQKQVQNIVIGAMAYVPGFDVYNIALKDVAFYRPYTIYGNQKTIDNRSVSQSLFGATDAVYNNMVQQQYQLGK